jgi:hypothetical protein
VIEQNAQETWVPCCAHRIVVVRAAVYRMKVASAEYAVLSAGVLKKIVAMTTAKPYHLNERLN